MGVNEFDNEEKEIEKFEINNNIEAKKAELNKLKTLLKLKDDPSIIKFLENFILPEYGIIAKLSDREFDTNKSFHLKGRQYQLRKVIHWQDALKNEIKKIKGEVTILEERLSGENPEHEPEA